MVKKLSIFFTFDFLFFLQVKWFHEDKVIRYPQGREYYISNQGSMDDRNKTSVLTILKATDSMSGKWGLRNMDGKEYEWVNSWNVSWYSAYSGFLSTDILFLC